MRLSMIKNKISLLLVIVLLFLLSFGEISYSAVGANDGSAFITKAEFDALVNTFNEQMDSYENSITSKIDGAIANYLAGQKTTYSKEISANLDKNGKMSNGIKLTWGSSVDGVFGYNTIPNRIAIENLYFRYLVTNNNWQSGYSNLYTWLKFDPNATLGYSQEFTVEKRKYLTSKEVDIVLNNGSKVKGYQRGKFVTYVNWDFEEVKPYANAAPGTSWSPQPRFVMNTGLSSLTQKSKNYNVGTQQATDWLQNCYVTITTKDIADDGETYSYDELMLPLSTAKEYYWDPLDTTSKLQVYTGKNTSGYSNRPWSTGNKTNTKWTSKDELNSYTSGGPACYDCYDCPWMKKEAVVNEMRLVNLNQVDNRHRAVKNGFILCTSENVIGTYKINAQADVDGRLYAYIGSNPVSNWQDEGFAGKSIRMNDTTKDYELTYEFLDSTEKACPIWICFLPADSTKIGTLKINSVSFESAE